MNGYPYSPTVHSAGGIPRVRSFPVIVDEAQKSGFTGTIGWIYDVTIEKTFGEAAAPTSGTIQVLTDVSISYLSASAVFENGIMISTDYPFA